METEIKIKQILLKRNIKFTKHRIKELENILNTNDVEELRMYYLSGQRIKNLADPFIHSDISEATDTMTVEDFKKEFKKEHKFLKENMELITFEISKLNETQLNNDDDYRYLISKLQELCKRTNKINDWIRQRTAYPEIM